MQCHVITDVNKARKFVQAQMYEQAAYSKFVSWFLLKDVLGEHEKTMHITLNACKRINAMIQLAFIIFLVLKEPRRSALVLDVGFFTHRHEPLVTLSLPRLCKSSSSEYMAAPMCLHPPITTSLT